MGLFWELLQQSRMSQHETRAGDLEQRVERLESDLQRTQTLLHQVIAALERQSEQDLDGDGRVG